MATKRPEPQATTGNVVWWALQSLSPLAFLGILFYAGWFWRDFDQVKRDVDHLKWVIERIDVNVSKGTRSYERGKVD